MVIQNRVYVQHLSGGDLVDNRLIKPPPALNACHKPLAVQYNCHDLNRPVMHLKNEQHRGNVGKQWMKPHVPATKRKACL